MLSAKRFSLTTWSTLSFLLLLTAWSAEPVMAAQDAVICPADRINSPGNICTASDVQLAAAAVAVTQTGLTCFPGDTVEVAVAGTVNLRKGDRFDIGVWVSTDGLPMDLRGGSNGAPDEGGAKNCEVLPLPSEPIAIDIDPNIFVIDSFDDAATPQDCYDTKAANNGDISSGFAMTSLRDTIIDGQVDSNGDGVIDVNDDTTTSPVPKVFGAQIVGGGVDINNDGIIDGTDDGIWNGYAVENGVIDVTGDGNFGNPDDDSAQTYNDLITLTCVAGPTGKLALETLVSWHVPSDAANVCEPTLPDTYGDFNNQGDPIMSSSKCSVSSSEIDIDIVGKLTIVKLATPDDGSDFEFTYTNDSPPQADVNPNIPDLSVASPFLLKNAAFAEIFAEIGTGPAEIIITETNIPAGWDLADLTCTGDDLVATTIDVANKTATVTLQYNDLNPAASQSDVTCAFTNKTLPSLEIVKNTVGGNGAFNFIGNHGLPPFTLDTGVINSASRTFTNLQPAIDYSIIESIPAGWNLSPATCSNGSGDFVIVADTGQLTNITLALGEHVTCTFTNVLGAAATITKTTVGGDDTFGFTSDLPNNLTFSLTTSGGTSPAASESNLVAGTYTITEDVKAGWELASIDCLLNGSPTGTVTGRSIEVTVGSGDSLACTFANHKHATLEVIKQTDPDADPATFDFTGTVNGTISDNQTLSFTGQAGVFTTDESPTAGWDLTGIVCTGATNSTVLIGGTAGYVEGDTDVSATMAPGETVTCIYANTKRGSLTIVKSITAVGPASQDFAFTSDVPGNLAFTLSPVDAATDDQLEILDLKPGLYSVLETDPAAAGWALISSSCGDGSPTDGILLDPGEDLTCTFNNAPLGSATIIKTAVGGDGQFDFQWGTDTNASIPEGELADFSLTTPGPTATKDFSNKLLLNSPYDLTEVGSPAPVGPYLQTWNLTDTTCADATGDSTFNPGLNESDATIVAAAAETVSCTFTNTLDGTLVIRKQTLPDGDVTDFSFTGSHAGLTGNLQDFDNAAAELSETGAPGLYGTEETIPPGWVLTDISCTGAINSTVSIGDIGDTTIFVPGDVLVQVDVAAGETVICTYINTKDGSLTIVKDTVGGDGQFSFNHDVPLVVSPFVIDTAVDNTKIISTSLQPGSYLVSEVIPTGWDLTNIVCTGNTDSTITIGGGEPGDGFDPGDDGVTVDMLSGEDIICTFTNTERASLTLVKTVTTDHGGTAIATDWTLSAAGPTSPLSGAGGVAATLVLPGTYVLSETAGPAGYTPSAWSCTAGTLTVDSLELAPGEIAVCTINNNDDAASLSLVKTVTNDNGGTALITDWTLSAAGPTSPLTGAGGFAPTPVSAGTYILSESTGPAGYTPGTWSCTGGVLTGDSLVLALGETAVCTINNNDDAPGLTLVKTVTNDNGGTAAITDWTLSAAGPTPISGVSGSAAVTDAAVNAGDYTLSEAGGPTGYTASDWSCEGGSLAGSVVTIGSGETVVCTIVNDDDTAVLTLVKTITNDDEGTAVETDWTLNAAGPTPLTGVTATPAVTAVDVDAGVYTLSESGGPTGYVAGAWSCTGGSLAGDQLALGNGETAVCTINNDDEPAAINLAKTVNGPAVRQPGGTYLVVYTITATNTGQGPGVYDLIDAFTPGVGITLDTADAVYLAGTEDDQSGTLGAYPNFVTGEALAAGMDESWTVTAIFTVDLALVTAEGNDCDDTNAGGENTGFTNGVTGSSTDTDLTDNTACTEFIPPAISLDKTADVATYDTVGDVINYDYLITNLGPDVLDPGLSSVVDDKETVTCPAAAPLLVGGTVTCTASHVITQADLDAGLLTNVATAMVDDVTSNDDTVTVTATILPPVDYEPLPVPVNDKLALLLLTLMLLATGWYFRPAGTRKF